MKQSKVIIRSETNVFWRNSFVSVDVTASYHQAWTAGQNDQDSQTYADARCISCIFIPAQIFIAEAPYWTPHDYVNKVWKKANEHLEKPPQCTFVVIFLLHIRFGIVGIVWKGGASLSFSRWLLTVVGSLKFESSFDRLWLIRFWFTHRSGEYRVEEGLYEA